MSLPFDPAEVQGNILRGYGRARVRHLVLEIKDLAPAKQWLGVTASGGSDTVPAITSEAPWGEERPDYCFNLGVTFEGLKALGLSDASLDSFPSEFVDGMISRAVKLGDVGDSAPEHWYEPFAEPHRVQLIVSIHADDEEHLDRVQQQIESVAGGRAFSSQGACDGFNFHGNDVHFGYRDNISQPRFEGVHDPARYPDSQPLAPVGTVLLGHPTAYENMTWRVPEPRQLGLNGTFNAYRILKQDVAGFEAFLDQSATELISNPAVCELLPEGAEKQWKGSFTRHQALRELVAAKMCGRWRTGVPLANSPTTPFPAEPVPWSDFDYDPQSACPYSAHTRRCNPRGGHIVQRVANNTRRLVRRGIPYGPAYEPGKPDDEDRGLLGNFLSGNLGAQFEAVMCDWLNLGLHDPRITGTSDPLLGANDPDLSWFDLPLPSGETIRLHGLPRFVVVRGGAYTFLPSLPAIRHLGS